MSPSFRAAPVIETERLTLRGHTLDDFAECAAIWGDPRVTRFIGGRPSTEEEAWARLLRNIGHWAALGFGYWAVREKSSGRFVGDVGLADLRRDLQPSLAGIPESGWVLAPWAHGQGFATEAVRAVLAWGETHLRATRTVCLIAPDNAPSLRVAAKCGYKEFGRTTYKGEPTVLLERHAGG
jgi:RimJ/RimL family protein N-acetyltransferase